jgi:hypothetical protein
VHLIHSEISKIKHVTRDVYTGVREGIDTLQATQLLAIQYLEIFADL